MNVKVGHVVKLKKPYRNDYGEYGLVIEITRSEFLGVGGWITFDYCILINSGQLIHISESCFEFIL